MIYGNRFSNIERMLWINGDVGTCNSDSRVGFECKQKCRYIHFLCFFFLTYIHFLCYDNENREVNKVYLVL